MQIVTDKNKVALYYKNEALTYKEFILNTKKIKQFSKIKEFKIKSKILEKNSFK